MIGYGTILTHPRVRVFFLISFLLGIFWLVLHQAGYFAGIDSGILSGSRDLFARKTSSAFVNGIPIFFFSLFPGTAVLFWGNEKGIFSTLAAGFIYAGVFAVLKNPLPLTAVVIAAVISLIRVMGWGAAFLEREKEEINRLFGYFLDNAVLNYLLHNPGLIRTGGVTKDLTILFADIRGFTARCESLPPETIIALLREYFHTPLKFQQAQAVFP